jgi:hypothetical protein
VWSDPGSRGSPLLWEAAWNVKIPLRVIRHEPMGVEKSWEGLDDQDRHVTLTTTDMQKVKETLTVRGVIWKDAQRQGCTLV